MSGMLQSIFDLQRRRNNIVMISETDLRTPISTGQDAAGAGAAAPVTKWPFYFDTPIQGHIAPGAVPAGQQYMPIAWLLHSVLWPSDNYPTNMDPRGLWFQLSHAEDITDILSDPTDTPVDEQPINYTYDSGGVIQIGGDIHGVPGSASANTGILSNAQWTGGYLRHNDGIPGGVTSRYPVLTLNKDADVEYLFRFYLIMARVL